MQTFTDSDKLSGKEQYDQVFANARKLHHAGLLFLFAINNTGYPRLGLAVSKRVLSKASARNYVKRCIRESFRRQKQNLPGIDIVVLPKKDLKVIKTCDWYELCAQGWQRLADLSHSCSSAPSKDIS